MEARSNLIRKAEISSYRGLKSTAQKYNHFFIRNWGQGLVGSFLYLRAISQPTVSCVSKFKILHYG